MMKFKRLLTVGLMALFCAGTATAASQLNSVQVTPSANAATVNLHTTGTYAHKEYRPDEHLMLVDLTGVTAASAVDHAATVNSQALKAYKLSTYTSASGSEVTRIELTLGDGVSVNVNDVSDGLKIQLSSGGARTPDSPVTPASAVALTPHPAPVAAATPKTALAEAATPSRSASAGLVPVTKPVSSSAPNNASAAQEVSESAVKEAPKSAAKEVSNKEVTATKSAPLPLPVSPAVARTASTPHSALPSAAAGELVPATIRNVSVRSGQGTLDIVIDGPSSAHSFLLKHPDRLVIDFNNAVLKSSVRNIAVRSKDVLQIRVGRFQSEPPVTRIVIDLSAPHAFDLIPADKQVIVRVKTADAEISSALRKAAPAPALASEVAPYVPGRSNTDHNSESVHVSLDRTSFTLPAAPVAVPADSTSQLRDQQTSEHNKSATEPKAVGAKTPAAAVTATAPKAVQPAAEAVRPPAPKAFATTTPESTPAASTHVQLVQQVFGPNLPAPDPSKATDIKATDATAPSVAAVAAKVAPPPVEMARLTPPAPEQAPAIVANKPTASAPSPLPDQQVSEPVTPPVPPTAAAPKVTPPPVEMARVTPPAPEQSTPAPVTPATSASKYTGEPISVNLKDVDLKDFFRLIHEISGLNIVLDPSVHGTVTLVLDDVPWDQALDIVLKNNSLDRELQGNVLRIAATDTLRKEAVDRRAQSEAIALAVDRQTITRFLSYAKAREIVPTIKKFLTARGDVISDERTNALIISDIPSVLPNLDRLISQLDRKSQEVEIEVRVVSATRSFSRDLGVQLGFNWGNGVTTLGGSNPNGIIPVTPSGLPSSVPLFSNLPATGPTSGFSLSNITANYGIDAVLTAAETHNLAKVLSRPRVVTQSNVKAEVKQGVKLPITTAATANALATTSYIDSVLRLSVTPQITADNTIFLTVDVENTQPQGEANSQGNFILTTQQTTTQVLVTDGGTVVIGGVIQTSNSVSTTQTPFLGNIPILGNLFKERFVKTETDELIFFITPKIIQT